MPKKVVYKLCDLYVYWHKSDKKKFFLFILYIILNYVWLVDTRGKIFILAIAFRRGIFLFRKPSLSRIGYL